MGLRTGPGIVGGGRSGGGRGAVVALLIVAVAAVGAAPVSAAVAASAAVAVAVPMAAVAGPASAKPAPSQETGIVVRSAEVRVELADTDTDATVRIDYLLVAGPSSSTPTAPDGAGAVGTGSAGDARLEVLEHPGVSISDLTVDGGAVVPLAVVSGTRRAGSVALASLPEEPGGRRLRLVYRVGGAIARDQGALLVRLPIVSVDAPPATAVGDVFRAFVTVPPAWRVVDPFPSGLREVASGRHEVGLPVVPSLLDFAGRTDGAWRPGLDLLVEALTLLVLVAFGLGGVRHLRRARP